MSTARNTDSSQQLQQQIQSAYEKNAALKIVGGNSKNFYGHNISAETLNVANHCGVINYEPTELVITARAGTKLSEIEKLLDENDQMLAFEPPAYSADATPTATLTATLGGTIACNFSGPRRAYAGAARDFLLGCKIINGKGETLSFGGEVMKNVAGYDIARLMAGAMGTLGLLLEVSLKVLPKTETENTLLFQYNYEDALKKIQDVARTAIPVSATSYHDGTLHIRLSGTDTAVTTASRVIGGDKLENANHYWLQLKEQKLDFFNTEKNLWRMSLASDIKLPDIDTKSNDILYEWGGALRWLKSDTANEIIQNTLAKADGHATLFRRNKQMPDTDLNIFQPLSPGLKTIHKNLKQAFDPKNILNPGKQYPELYSKL